MIFGKKKQVFRPASGSAARSRRLFLQKAVFGLVTLPALGQLLSEQAFATSLPGPTKLPTSLPSLAAETKETASQKAALEALLNSGASSGMAGDSLQIPSPAFPEGVNFLIPGPQGLPLTEIMSRFLAEFAAFLPGNPTVYVSAVGTRSGITLANRFTALAPANGQNIAVLPGTALFARLAGNPAAQFNIDGLIAVAGGHRPVVTVSRASFSPDKTRPGQAIRVAVAGNSLFSDNDSLYVLLGLDIAGFPAVPVQGFRTVPEKLAALAEGKIDLAVMSGKEFTQIHTQSLKAGLIALFTQGRLTAEGTRIRDKDFQNTPTLEEYLTALHHPPSEGLLKTAWQAVAATGSATFTLVLPPLTEPSMVALWRKSATEALTDKKLAEAAAKELMTFSGPIAAATSLRLANAPEPARLALHQWITAQKFMTLS